MRNPIVAAFDECERLSAKDRQHLAEQYSRMLRELAQSVRVAGRHDLQPLLADLADDLNAAAAGISKDRFGSDVLVEAGCLIFFVQGIVEERPRLRIVQA